MPMLTQKFKDLHNPSDFKLIVNVPQGYGEMAVKMKQNIEKLGVRVQILESNNNRISFFIICQMNIYFFINKNPSQKKI